MQNDVTFVLRMWIPVHVDVDDHWLDGWAEYSDAYCVGMSVILLALAARPPVTVTLTWIIHISYEQSKQRKCRSIKHLTGSAMLLLTHTHLI